MEAYSKAYLDEIVENQGKLFDYVAIDATLAECAVKDRIWGIGLSMNDPDRLDRARWKGQNLLGYTLMMVREKL